MFEPITFPTDRFGEFSKTAFTDTNNSDKDVPKPIIIKPMKKSETLNFFLMLWHLIIIRQHP